MVDAALQHEIEQFLYDEAWLLDERRYREWLDLFTEDAHYWMPIRMTRAQGNEDEELTKEDENSYFDDDKAMLLRRIEKLETGYAWAENPPSRTRHIVSNVRIHPSETIRQVTLDCYFVVYRTRLDIDEDLWIGRREDTLRKEDGQWRIARRTIILDETVLKSKNLSSFF